VNARLNPSNFLFMRLEIPRDKNILISIHKEYDREYGFSRAEGEHQILADYLASHADIYHPFALMDGESPAGYIRAYDRLSTSSCDIVLMLDLVYILPQYRGKGLGKRIMQDFIDFAVKSKKARIDLLTDLDNPAAVKLYENFGFKGRQRHQMILFLKDHPDLKEYFSKKCESR
jgi:ribosomal protein S18 acetylase RimI-like enzyme